MFLILTQCLKYYQNKSPQFHGMIIVIAAILFTVIDALVYSAMIGWNSREPFHFKVSPVRKQCMAEQVCTASKNGKCIPFNESNLNTDNFPPKYSRSCVGNGDCPGDPYGSGCHKWTVGWNGNFPMNYNAWINSDNPVGWGRTDATGAEMGYVPPTSSCTAHPIPIPPPKQPDTPQPDEYSSLHAYGFQPQFPGWKLPPPGGQFLMPIHPIKENYLPPFLDCTNRKRVKEGYDDPLGDLDIIFYGSTGCGYCTKSKDMFEKAGLLDKITYKDSGKHAQEMKKYGGGGGVPHFYSKKNGTSHTGYTGTVDKLVKKLS